MISESIVKVDTAIGPVELKTLHAKNLDWEKAKRWGKLLVSEDGIECYLWNGGMYWIDSEMGDQPFKLAGYRKK